MTILRWMMMLFCISISLRAFFVVLYKIYLGGSIDGWDIAMLIIGALAGWIALMSFKNLRRQWLQRPSSTGSPGA